MNCDYQTSLCRRVRISSSNLANRSCHFLLPISHHHIIKTYKLKHQPTNQPHKRKEFSHNSTASHYYHYLLFSQALLSPPFFSICSYSFQQFPFNSGLLCFYSSDYYFLDFCSLFDCRETRRIMILEIENLWSQLF